MGTSEFKEAAKRLGEINSVIAKLDPSIRASAFDILKVYVTDTDGIPGPSKTSLGRTKGHTSLEKLISEHGDGKAAENVILLVAFWYSQYGSHPFSLEWIRDQARDAGLTIPNRFDMTLRNARRKGKSLFQVGGGRGKYKPTVVGETHIKETYNVRKGTQSPQDKDE